MAKELSLKAFEIGHHSGGADLGRYWYEPMNGGSYWFRSINGFTRMNCDATNIQQRFRITLNDKGTALLGELSIKS